MTVAQSLEDRLLWRRWFFALSHISLFFFINVKNSYRKQGVNLKTFRTGSQCQVVEECFSRMFFLRSLMSRGRTDFRKKRRSGSNIQRKTTSLNIAKTILGIYTCPTLTITQKSIAVMLYNGSIGRRSITIMTNPVMSIKRDILHRYVT